MGTPRPHVSRHVSGRAPRRGRRSRRPVFRSPIAGCTRVLHLPPVAIFLSTAKEIWKRTPPKTDGFWISLSSNCNCGAKRFRTESPAPLSPLPLPRTAFDRPQWAHPAHTYLAMSPVAHPVGAGVPDGPYRRTLEYRRTLVYPSVGAGVPDGPFSVLRLRAAPASCMYASGGHISFNSERNMEKNAAKNHRFLDFPFVRL